MIPATATLHLGLRARPLKYGTRAQSTSHDLPQQRRAAPQPARAAPQRFRRVSSHTLRVDARERENPVVLYIYSFKLSARR